jgi:phosphoribosylanthranilate isomerase
MIGSFNIKVCGIRHAADVALVNNFGADYLGVNCWAGSPRFVNPTQRKNLLREIKPHQRIAVTVNPTLSETQQLIDEGFAAVQIHFDPSTKACDVRAISEKIGVEKIWLAPKVADGKDWPAEIISLAKTFLHDAHSTDAFGGTGKQSDWQRFQKLQKTHPDKVWILAGGLGPKNILEALKSGAVHFDLNSGVEISPGLKSAEKLAEIHTLLLNYKQS